MYYVIQQLSVHVIGGQVEAAAKEQAKEDFEAERRAMQVQYWALQVQNWAM